MRDKREVLCYDGGERGEAYARHRPQSEASAAAEGADQQPAERANGLPKAVWYAGAVVLALLLAFLTLLAYRTARIRRQRKQIREMRMRARRQRDSEFHE